jgi:hypothetical protein
MSSNKPIPANDGKNGFYIYRGIVDVNQVHLRWGDWIGGNPKDSNQVLTKCISKMNAWRTNGDGPDIMIIAMHPHWTNSWICWGATANDTFHNKFKSLNPSGSFTTTPVYGNVQIFTLQQLDNSEFKATPLNVAIGNNSFNINTFPSTEYYKNGTYTFSASSSEKGLNGQYNITIQPCHAFTYMKQGLKGWMSNGSGPSASRFLPQTTVNFGDGYSQAPYDKSGKYVGGGGCGNTWTTIDVDKRTHSGEWIQVQLPYPLLLRRYSLMTNARRFIILGSMDGKSWNHIEQKSDMELLTDPNKEFVVYANEAYSYYRLVILETNVKVTPGAEFYGVGIFLFTLIGTYDQGNRRERFQSSIGNEGFAVYEGLDNIYSKETTLLADLSDFNRKYIEYTDCSRSNCATLSQKRAAMTQAYNVIMQTDIPNMNRAMPSGGLTPAQYDASFANLVTTHDNVVKLRSELDIKMKELNRDADSKYADYKGNFDSAIYTNILVTVLATTLLYFTFTKL